MKSMLMTHRRFEMTRLGDFRLVNSRCLLDFVKSFLKVVGIRWLAYNWTLALVDGFEVIGYGLVSPHYNSAAKKFKKISEQGVS